MTRADFLAKWRARLGELARFDATVNGAKLCGEVLSDFEAVMASEDDELHTLEEAASRSGYSKDHLRRRVREGKLHATRRGRRLFFRDADLPKKLRIVDDERPRAYDPIAHARRVAARRTHGGSRHDTQAAA